MNEHVYAAIEFAYLFQPDESLFRATLTHFGHYMMAKNKGDANSAVPTMVLVLTCLSSIRRKTNDGEKLTAIFEAALPRIINPDFQHHAIKVIHALENYLVAVEDGTGPTLKWLLEAEVAFEPLMKGSA